MIEVFSILPPIHLGLCFSEEEVVQFLMEEGLSAGEIPMCGRSDGEAVTCKNDGHPFVGAVRVNEHNDDREGMMGLLVHESTHIATNYFQSIGVEVLDDEIRAYTQQAIAQSLIEEYLQRIEKTKG